MGRAYVFFEIWLAGYMLGVVGYLLIPPLSNLLIQAIPHLFMSERFAGAFITGLATSIVSVVSVVLWANLSD